MCSGYPDAWFVLLMYLVVRGVAGLEELEGLG